MPVGSVAFVVICSGGLFTGTVSDAVAVFWAESVRVTLKVNEPAVGGVPLRTPAALNVSQAGRPAADQV